MAMVFQDPLSALHPYYTIGNQIVEAYRIHHDASKDVARKRAIEMLERVGIPNPNRRVDQYPHEFSGGMRQRAMTTTALDVTVQAQILELMKDLQKEFGSAIIIITHDLGVVADVADDIIVMYGGKCVEKGSVDEVFYTPQHPYTWGLLASMPRLDKVRSDRLDPIPGNPPSLINLPSGCAFNPRCAHRSEVEGDLCRTQVPDLLEVRPGQSARCHIDAARRTDLYAEISGQKQIPVQDQSSGQKT